MKALIRTAASPLRSGALAALLATALVPTGVQAQLGVTAHAGTLGLGADVSMSVAPLLGLRAGVNFQPWEPSYTLDEVDLTASMQSPNVTALLDFYPVGGFLRLVGGVVRFGSDIEVVGVPLQSVDVNGVMYEPSQIGTVTGRIVTKQFAPYAGIGFGNPTGGFGLVVDLGVAFQGAPSLEIRTDGLLADEPLFQTNLDAEIAQAEQDLEPFRFFPVVSIGFAIGL